MLYETYAKNLPIVDFHNHICVADVQAKRQFSNITELWLTTDPYKHRLMRICGVEEHYITGDATAYEKFEKFCEIFPMLAGHPVYDWSRMELAQSIAKTEQEYKELQDSFETLKAQKSLSQAVMEAYAEEDLQIEVQRTPTKKNPITKQETPAQVTMAEADYLVLKERVAATSWIRRAMEDLKHLGV